jgi:uncharacterized protein (TIGR00375 family)
MKFIADFHLHSKYSRATSPRSDLEHFAQSATIKGIKVLGTGDFTHPLWLQEIKEKLKPKEGGLFVLKNSDYPTRFLLTSEINCIYSKKNKLRKVHILVFSPSIEKAEKINARLNLIGNLRADGRPTLGLDAKELTKIILEICPECLIVPAHAWTPWFGIFGSKSGFDSLEECFEDYTKYIYAIETGLSSSPSMNWRVSDLDRITLISNSDAHSPSKIGREANVFDTELNYQEIVEAIKTKNREKFLYTIEFYPQEGKYHYDGHRECDISLSPQESKKYNDVCPKCLKPLTLGVLHRVEELADRKADFIPENVIPFKSVIPLEEIIAQAIQKTPQALEVKKEYQNLIEKFGSEFRVLLEASEADLKEETLPEIAQGIIKAREGDVFIKPGFDGVFGKIELFGRKERKEIGQKTLF